MRVILAGQGQVLYHLARHFSQRPGLLLTVVTPLAAEARQLAEQLEANVLCGDPTLADILQEAGALRADVVLALSPQDEDNLAICQLARYQFELPRVIALVNDPDNEAVLTRLGVSVAVSISRILATLLEEEAGFEAIRQMMPLAEGALSLSEIILRARDPAVGQQIDALGLPEQVLIGAIIRQQQVVIPGGTTQLQAQDHLLLISKSEHLDQVLQRLQGAAPG